MFQHFIWVFDFFIQSSNRFQMLLCNPFFPPPSSLEWSNKCIFIPLKSLSFWNCRLFPLSLGDILFGHEPNVIAAPNLKNRHIKRPCQCCLLWLRSPLKALCHLMLLCTLAWSAIIAGIKLCALLMPVYTALVLTSCFMLLLGL